VRAVSTATASDGASIAYEVVGDGPPIVLVHGIIESRRSWDPLIAPLAREHRVVAVDLRGHGASDRRPP
jgi:pimeloyl-ACP methyl ester carboxylesterase